MPIPPYHPEFGHFIMRQILMLIGLIAILLGIIPAILQWLWNTTLGDLRQLFHYSVEMQRLITPMRPLLHVSHYCNRRTCHSKIR